MNPTLLELLLAATLLLAGVSAAAQEGCAQNCPMPQPRPARPAIMEVPRSIVKQLTPEQMRQALEYAKRNNIQWRIVEDK